MGAWHFISPQNTTSKHLYSFSAQCSLRPYSNLKQKKTPKPHTQKLFKMCFKFNRCFCLSLSLNHMLCLAGQQDTAATFVSVTRNLFFSRFVFSVPEDPKLDLGLTKNLLHITGLYLHGVPT